MNTARFVIKAKSLLEELKAINRDLAFGSKRVDLQSVSELVGQLEDELEQQKAKKRRKRQKQREKAKAARRRKQNRPPVYYNPDSKVNPFGANMAMDFEDKRPGAKERRDEIMREYQKRLAFEAGYDNK